MTVGRFAIRSRLGAGGMGEVYRADDTRLKRPVALKRITPRLHSDENRDRFLHEAQCVSGLMNPHIAGVYDVLEANDELFLVMEYVEGVTLRQRLAQPLGIEQFVGIAVQCAMALVAAHGRGIVHRDIKPENIMLTPEGQVKVLDFGVAKDMLRDDEQITLQTGETLRASFGGTPAYMAPEVLLEHQPDQRADIFSLGAVFYEGLTGRHPFQANSFVATADRVLHDVPPPLTEFNPKVPRELQRIVAKMLAKDPAERYATAADLLVDLRAVQRQTAYPVPARVARELPAAPRRTAKWWAAAVALGLLLAVGIGALPKVRQRLPWFRPAITGPKNLAVLPFRAIGAKPENQAFSDGITETLTAKLTQLTASHQLQVAPAQEVRTRRASSASTARNELGASLVVEGTLYRSGNAVRVTYSLVDTGSLRQLRADTITVDASNPFAVQDRVAEGIVRMLELELNSQERQALRARGTQVAGAHDYYLQGRGYLQNYDRVENVENAISVFQRALQLDPNYALAHAGLGEAYWKMYDAHRQDGSWVQRARLTCQRALNLDASIAAAQICLGTVEDNTGHSTSAVSRFQRALALESTNDDAYRGLALAYEHLGKPGDAERTYREAIRLRPHYWAGYNWLGLFYFRQARYPEAVEMLKQVVALAPDSIRGYYNLCAIYIHQGRYSDAIGMCERSAGISRTAAAYSNLATAYFYQRRFDDATRTYEEALKLDQQDYTIWWNLGEAYYWAPGKRAQAASTYRKAISLADEKLKVNPRDAKVLGVEAVCYAMLGERKQAMGRLDKARRIAPNSVDLHFKAAVVYHQLGETEKALAWLQRALAAGMTLSQVRDTPNFDSLQRHPRFQQFIQDQQPSKGEQP